MSYSDIFGPPEEQDEYPLAPCRRCNDYPCQCLNDGDDECAWDDSDGRECPACGFMVCECGPLTLEEIAACECPF